ncbi:MAG: hypothetical protein EP297_01565 [Gammaproteobacteria bacterium]|nr:MAG: hypothetical protein EP297_01565 [Gammaproteobacteria bacterium]
MLIATLLAFVVNGYVHADWSRYSGNPFEAMMLAMLDFMGADAGSGLMDYNSYLGLSFPFRSGLGGYPGLGMWPYGMPGNTMMPYANPWRSLGGSTAYPVSPYHNRAPTFLDGQWYGLNGDQLELRQERYIMASQEGHIRVGKFAILNQHIILLNPENRTYQEYEFLRNQNTLILKDEYGNTLIFEKYPSKGSIWDQEINPSIQDQPFYPGWSW